MPTPSEPQPVPLHGRNEIRRRPDARARVDFGAALEQQLDDRGMRLRARRSSAPSARTRDRAHRRRRRASSNSVTAGTAPVRAAVINTVSPIGATLFASAPASSRRRDRGCVAVLRPPGTAASRRSDRPRSRRRRTRAAGESCPCDRRARPSARPWSRRRRACRRPRLDRAGGSRQRGRRSRRPRSTRARPAGRPRPRAGCERRETSQSKERHRDDLPGRNKSVLKSNKRRGRAAAGRGRRASGGAESAAVTRPTPC